MAAYNVPPTVWNVQGIPRREVREVRVRSRDAREALQIDTIYIDRREPKFIMMVHVEICRLVWMPEEDLF